MVALLRYCEDAPNDTVVWGIYPSYEEAQDCVFYNFIYQEFDFGKTSFDIHKAKIRFGKNPYAIPKKVKVSVKKKKGEKK